MTTWSPRKKSLISALLMVHLLAIFSAPFAGPPAPSIFANELARFFRPYLQAGYLFHGYRFFAPNPGASHLIEYEAILENGEITTGTFPDLKEHWPRLYYHRHFMISETLNSLEAFSPEAEMAFRADQVDVERRIEAIEQEGNRDLAAQLRAEQVIDQRQFANGAAQRSELLIGIANSIRTELKARIVRLYLVEHRIPSQVEVIRWRGQGRGDPLLDPTLYSKRQVFETSVESKGDSP
jgi:hypothetical protein